MLSGNGENRAMVVFLLIGVGIALVIVGVVALFKLKGSDAGDTSFGLGPVKITTKSPALALIVLGLSCIGARLFVPTDTPMLPKDVVQSYLGLVDDYNSANTAGYYAHFAKPMECFYSVPNADIRTERPRLDTHLQVTASDLFPLAVEPDRVELCDRGRWLEHTVLRQQHKIIVMKKVGGEWRVTVETGADEDRCYRSENASKC
jgi:hypothetical protein